MRRRGTILRRGDRRKADLLEIDLGQGALVVKDFAGKSTWRRWLGRVQIRREERAYRSVGEIEGVPRLAGRVDAHALALEKIEGVWLAVSPQRFRDAPVLLEQLREIVERLHRRGLAHLDLRGKTNVLLRPDGRPVVVDLASAIWLRPGSIAHRLLFRWLALTDRTGLLKWKARLAPELLTPKEASLLHRFRLLRRLWIFNRRHRRPAAAPLKKGSDPFSEKR